MSERQQVDKCGIATCIAAQHNTHEHAQTVGWSHMTCELASLHSMRSHHNIMTICSTISPNKPKVIHPKFHGLYQDRANQQFLLHEHQSQALVVQAVVSCVVMNLLHIRDFGFRELGFRV